MAKCFMNDSSSGSYHIKVSFPNLKTINGSIKYMCKNNSTGSY